MPANRRARIATALVVVASLIICGGCETRGAARANTRAASTVPPAPEWWIEPLFATQRQYLSAILQICMQTGLAGHEACVKENMIASLGVGADAAAQCDPEGSTVLFIECIDKGTSAERAYVALDRGSEMDWRSPSQSLRKAAALLSEHLTSKCLYSGQKDCIAREVTYLFALDPREADRCVQVGDIAFQVRCAIGLSLLEKYRSALVYVS